MAVAPAQVTLQLQDRKLADMMNVVINGRAARAYRIIQRRGVVAL